MKKETSRQLQAKKTKKKLIDVSLSLIKQHGFDSVSIQQICDEAGVSVGAFYHHLHSKSGIVIEIYLQCDEYFETYVVNHLAGDTYVEKIIDYIGYQLKFAEDTGVDLLTQVYKAQITDGNDFFLTEDRGLTNGLYELVKKAQDNGELLSDFSYREIGNEILIISRGIMYNWCQSEGGYSLRELGKKVVANYLVAYKK